MKFLYLSINLACISIPLLCSFHPRIRFNRYWAALWPGLFLTAFLFLIWDYFFTTHGVWGFNPRYISGVAVGPLPLEEILFFICIPYACMFTYFCIKLFLPEGFHERYVRHAHGLSLALALVLLALAIANLDKLYTSWTFILTGVLLLLVTLVRKTNSWLVPFYLSFFLLLFPFAVTNGILTGTGIEEEVVWYNDGENLGFRLGTIPVEDIFYAFLFILSNTIFFETLLRRGKLLWQSEPS